MKHMIVIWAGAIVDIPAGWVLCDGNNNTPDLRGCFIVGAGGALNPDDSATTNVATDAGIPYYALAFIMKSP
jgi:hypothetical protein